MGAKTWRVGRRVRISRDKRVGSDGQRRCLVCLSFALSSGSSLALPPFRILPSWFWDSLLPQLLRRVKVYDSAVRLREHFLYLYFEHVQPACYFRIVRDRGNRHLVCNPITNRLFTVTLTHNKCKCWTRTLTRWHGPSPLLNLIRYLTRLHPQPHFTHSSTDAPSLTPHTHTHTHHHRHHHT